MAIISVYDGYGLIDQEPDIDFLWALDRELSYEVPGAEFSKIFKGFTSYSGKQVNWDGIRRIMKEDLSFPKGLLARVQNFYQDHNKSFQLQNFSSPKLPAAPIDILPTLANLNKFPYPYQLQIAEAALNHDIGIIRAATGAGKTNCCALMTAQFGKKTVLFTIGTDLLHQTYKFFCQVFGQDLVGIVGDGICDIKEFNIVSVWTAGKVTGVKNNLLLDATSKEKMVAANKVKDIKILLKQAKVCIFDECHLAACDTIQAICRNLNPDHIYGMSASPWRDDNSDLLIESVLGSKIIDISASYLIKGGFLTKPYIEFLKTPAQKLPKNYQKIYKDYVVENPDRNNMIIEQAIELVQQGYQVLVTYNNLSHGKLLHEMLKSHLRCAKLSGADSNETRNTIKSQLEQGEIECILASKIFDIGVDLPSLSGLIIASGGKSSVRSLQRIGRVIRRHPGKTHAKVIDFWDQAPYLKDHSKERRNIYSLEEEFEITCPQ